MNNSLLLNTHIGVVGFYNRFNFSNGIFHIAGIAQFEQVNGDSVFFDMVEGDMVGDICFDILYYRFLAADRQLFQYFFFRKGFAGIENNNGTVQFLQAHHSLSETVCFARTAAPQCKEVHIVFAFLIKDLVGNTTNAVFGDGDKVFWCRSCAVPFRILTFLYHEFHVCVQNLITFQGNQSRTETSMVRIYHKRIAVFLRACVHRRFKSVAA